MRIICVRHCWAVQHWAWSNTGAVTLLTAKKPSRNAQVRYISDQQNMKFGAWTINEVTCSTARTAKSIVENHPLHTEALEPGILLLTESSLSAWKNTGPRLQQHEGQPAAKAWILASQIVPLASVPSSFIWYRRATKLRVTLLLKSDSPPWSNSYWLRIYIILSWGEYSFFMPRGQPLMGFPFLSTLYDLSSHGLFHSQAGLVAPGCTSLLLWYNVVFSSLEKYAPKVPLHVHSIEHGLIFCFSKTIRTMWVTALLILTNDFLSCNIFRKAARTDFTLSLS